MFKGGIDGKEMEVVSTILMFGNLECEKKEKGKEWHKGAEGSNKGLQERERLEHVGSKAGVTVGREGQAGKSWKGRVRGAVGEGRAICPSVKKAGPLCHVPHSPSISSHLLNVIRSGNSFLKNAH